MTKILQMLQAVYSKQRFSDVCEFLKGDLCSICAASWNKKTCDICRKLCGQVLQMAEMIAEKIGILIGI
jgi:hypothetical protein